jgi:hypothetical protein
MAATDGLRKSSSDESSTRRRRVRPPWLQRHLLTWFGVTMLLAVVGSATAVVAANSHTRDNVNKTQQAFRASSAAIAATLQLAIQHETDLVVNAASFVTLHPDVSSSQFEAWVNSEGAYQRYPELRDLDYSKAQPAGTAKGSASAPGSSGSSVYRIARSGSTTVLTAYFPVYRGRPRPATEGQRPAKVLGRVELSFVPRILLNQAIRGHAGLALTFRLHVGSTNLGFRWGTVRGPSESRTIVLLKPWTVKVFAARPSSTILGSALLLLVAQSWCSRAGAATTSRLRRFISTSMDSSA